jgi:hypothetical protein
LLLIVNLLLANLALTVGGSESYLLTVAEELTRLGHSVTVWSVRADPHATELFAERGVRMVVDTAPPSQDCDVVIAQDGVLAYLLAERYPDVRRAFVMHSLYNLQTPPLLDAAGGPVFVLNDRIASRARAMSAGCSLVRLRQPLDLRRFYPRGVARRRARRVLALGNRLGGTRLRMLTDACSSLGLDFVQVGRFGRVIAAPEAEICEADIVVGYGRAALEAMGLGRAVYVWGHGGGDGWVTPESYAALEADGFTGGATDSVIDESRLRADFGEYRAGMGELNFDLVRLHHPAGKHVEALLSQLGSAQASPPTAEEEMARLVSLEYNAVGHAEQLAIEARELRERAEAAERLFAELVSSRRYRIGSALARPIDVLRAGFRRSSDRGR